MYNWFCCVRSNDYVCLIGKNELTMVGADFVKLTECWTAKSL